MQTVQTSPGIWEEVEDQNHIYQGDVLTDTRRWQSGDKVNSDFSVTNRVSILADPFAFDNLDAMKWIEFMGSKWAISSVEVSYPRLVISLGGVYNG